MSRQKPSAGPKDVFQRVQSEMLDSFDEELEMEIDDDRLSTLLADIAVGADREAVERNGTFLSPFRERLRQQGQTGHQEQDTLAGAGHGLGDLEASERFARSAGHDQLAAIGIS